MYVPVTGNSFFFLYLRIRNRYHHHGTLDRNYLITVRRATCPRPNAKQIKRRCTARACVAGTLYRCIYVAVYRYRTIRSDQIYRDVYF